MAEFRPSENFVANGVRGNYTIGLIASTFHLGALRANAGLDPLVADLRDRYIPIHQALVDAGTAKGAALGVRYEDTDSKDALLALLVSTHLPAWKQTAGNVSGYGPTTTAFKNLFGKNSLYNGGKQTDILEHVGTLRDRCLAVTSLAALGATIGTFYTTLETAMNAQVDAKSTVTTDIGDHIEALDDMCNMQFSDYGMVVYLFPTDPHKIKSFIDTETLQKHERGDLIAGIVHGNKIKTIGKKKFIITSRMKVTLTEPGIIWVIDSAKNPVKPTGVTIAANTPTIVDFPGLGDYNNRVIQIKNLSPITTATWVVEFL